MPPTPATAPEAFEFGTSASSIDGRRLFRRPLAGARPSSGSTSGSTRCCLAMKRAGSEAERSREAIVLHGAATVCRGRVACRPPRRTFVTMGSASSAAPSSPAPSPAPSSAAPTPVGPLSATALAHLPTHTAASSVEDTECPICVELIEPGETLVALPQCAHVFHAACARAWLARCALCPLCRAAVVIRAPSAAQRLPPRPPRASAPRSRRTRRGRCTWRPTTSTRR